MKIWYYNLKGPSIITFWNRCCICSPSLTETSLCCAWTAYSFSGPTQTPLNQNAWLGGICISDFVSSPSESKVQPRERMITLMSLQVTCPFLLTMVSQFQVFTNLLIRPCYAKCDPPTNSICLTRS